MVLADSTGISRVPAYSGASSSARNFDYWTLTFSGIASQLFRLLLAFVLSIRGPTTPICMHIGLGSSHFARRYFGNHFYFLFLQVLRCFTSLSLAPIWLFIHHMVITSRLLGSPIRISTGLLACLPLPVAFRCLLRPSSPVSA